MIADLSSYSTIVFDCDGVVLNSNKVKTQAFYDTVSHLGDEYAKEFIQYHREYGGVSRYKKFEYFLTNIIGHLEAPPRLDDLTQVYAELALKGLLESEVEPSLFQMKNACPNARWLIASGGDQVELRTVFSDKGLDSLFEGGIFGSPDSKEEILSRELNKGNITTPALFIGDSRYDHIAAKQFDFDFVFLSQWTEFSGWDDYCRNNKIVVSRSLSELIQ